LFGKNLFGYPLYNEFRVSSFFGSELILGSYLSRFFPILFGLFIFVDQIKKSKLLLCFVTLIFIFAEGLIFLSGERLALFFMNLSAIFIILMIKHYRVYRFWTYVASITLIVLLFNLFPSSKERFLDQTIHDFTRNTEDTLYIFSKPHNDMYITAYRLFLDNKYLGVGPRQFRKECDKHAVSEYSCETHPHNTYMELLSEAGIISFSIIFFIFLLICYYSIKHIFLKFVKNKKNYYFNDLEICLLSAILISLWPFSPSGSFFNNWMSIVYYFPIGIFLWQRSLNVKSHKVSKIQEN
jgi:O-antigen ligase